MFHLTKLDLETLRESLNARSAVLREEIEHALHESAAPDAPGPHRVEAGDEAVADLETAIAVAGLERDAAELDLVLEALARVDSGRYGLCADCGAPIAMRRLLAQPQALRCTRCETERERTRARPSLPAL